MNDEIGQIYGFSYTDCDGKEHSHTIQTPGVTWTECLNDYIRFLESVFGYNIMRKVRIEEPDWLKFMHEQNPDWLDPWTGEYFKTKDEEYNANTGNPGLSD